MSDSSTTAPLGYPDVLLPGAARSGTSFLTARLAAHPQIDNGAVKEPNYFSRHLDNGPQWYDALYEPRRPGLLRLDASMSYCVPEFPDALAAVAAAAPEARVIFAVRDPLDRAVSHYRLLKEYFTRERSADFGAAIAENEVYLGAGDYAHWLGQITELWGRERVLVVPFHVSTRDSDAPEYIFEWLGLEKLELEEDAGSRHRNDVVRFRHDWIRRTRKAVVRTPIYPWLRTTLGPERMRRLRSLATKAPETLSVEDALASCSPEQVREIEEWRTRSLAAATAALEEQDARLGLSWSVGWVGSTGEPAPADPA